MSTKRFQLSELTFKVNFIYPVCPPLILDVVLQGDVVWLQIMKLESNNNSNKHNLHRTLFMFILKQAKFKRANEPHKPF